MTSPPDHELLRDAASRAERYLANLDQRPVAVSATAQAGLAALRRTLPAHPTDPHAVLAELDRLGSPATTASTGGRFFGFVNGGTLPVTLAASWLATAWDQDAGMAALCPIGATLEEVVLDWLKEIFGLPAGTGGAFVTGGTMANAVALAAARHRLLANQGWDVERDGLFGAPPVTVIVGEEVHVSVLKALGLLGFGRERVERVPVDAQGRIRPDALPTVTQPALICLQAGNVNTGAVDPVRAVCEQVAGSGSWVHVDGAFGLWAAASPRYAHLVDGIAAADSWTVDAHKWLNVPYDSGIALVRDEPALRGAMGTSAAYLISSGAREPDQYTPEMSRRARGVEIWAALHTLGREGLAGLIDRCCRHATRFADGLASAGHAILNEVVLNQVLVSFGSPEITRAVIAAIQADGTCWCGGTTWQGQTAMRISVSSWATTEADVERSLATMLAIAAEMRAG